MSTWSHAFKKQCPCLTNDPLKRSTSDKWSTAKPEALPVRVLCVTFGVREIDDSESGRPQPSRMTPHEDTRHAFPGANTARCCECRQHGSARPGAQTARSGRARSRPVGQRSRLQRGRSHTQGRGERLRCTPTRDQPLLSRGAQALVSAVTRARLCVGTRLCPRAKVTHSVGLTCHMGVNLENPCQR